MFVGDYTIGTEGRRIYFATTPRPPRLPPPGPTDRRPRWGTLGDDTTSDRPTRFGGMEGLNRRWGLQAGFLEEAKALSGIVSLEDLNDESCVHENEVAHLNGDHTRVREGLLASDPDPGTVAIDGGHFSRDAEAHGCRQIAYRPPGLKVPHE